MAKVSQDILKPFIGEANVVGMIIRYMEEYFENYQEHVDCIIDLVLKFIGIEVNGHEQHCKKQRVLKLAIRHINDYEVIDTIATQYVDYVCSFNQEGAKSLISTYLSNIGSDHEIVEDTYLCLVCSTPEELRMINESFYMIHHHFEGLKKDMDDIDQSMIAFTAIYSVLTSLKKAVFISKDVRDDLSDDNNKDTKIRNLVICIKDQNSDLEDDFEKPNDDIFDDVNSK